MSREKRDKRKASEGDKLADAEQQAGEARRRLDEAERRAEEALQHAADDLGELSKKQEASAERLRRGSKEPRCNVSKLAGRR